MKLVRFKVKNFRSIEESDWISLGDNNCLVGTNEAGKTVLISRMYNGKYYVKFPYSKIEQYPSSRLISIIDNFENQLNIYDGYLKENEIIKAGIEKLLSNIRSLITTDTFKKNLITEIIEIVEQHITQHFGKKVNLPEFFRKSFITSLTKLNDAFDGKEVQTTKEIRQKILNIFPKFVYYSDYGNLDSEIFLPRVIEDFEREDLSEVARAKVRTLQVLFKYVKLSPQEIYELGNDRKVIVKRINHHNNAVISTEEVEPSECY